MLIKFDGKDSLAEFLAKASLNASSNSTVDDLLNIDKSIINHTRIPLNEIISVGCHGAFFGYPIVTKFSRFTLNGTCPLIRTYTQENSVRYSNMALYLLERIETDSLDCADSFVIASLRRHNGENMVAYISDADYESISVDGFPSLTFAHCNKKKKHSGMIDVPPYAFSWDSSYPRNWISEKCAELMPEKELKEQRIKSISQALLKDNRMPSFEKLNLLKDLDIETDQPKIPESKKTKKAKKKG